VKDLCAWRILAIEELKNLQHLAKAKGEAWRWRSSW